MKYYKRANIYKASNVVFACETQTATSYSWWVFLKKFKSHGKNILVLNTYNYSNTTTKHQYKLKSLLNDLGIRVDEFVEAPQGLQCISSATIFYNTRIMELTREINKRGSHKIKNSARAAQIESYKQKIKLIKSLKDIQ